MKLAHIEFEQLRPCDLNVRKHGHKEIADLVPSIRALGLLQPLLVRPNCEAFEIIAGRRRYNAIATLRRDGEYAEPIPCLIMADSDDALAIEASLTENIARLPMDEIDQYKAFDSLVAKGMSNKQVAIDLDIQEKTVKHHMTSILNKLKVRNRTEAAVLLSEAPARG